MLIRNSVLLFRPSRYTHGYLLWDYQSTIFWAQSLYLTFYVEVRVFWDVRSNRTDSRYLDARLPCVLWDYDRICSLNDLVWVCHHWWRRKSCVYQMIYHRYRYMNHSIARLYCLVTSLIILAWCTQSVSDSQPQSVDIFSFSLGTEYSPLQQRIIQSRTLEDSLIGAWSIGWPNADWFEDNIIASKEVLPRAINTPSLRQDTVNGYLTKTFPDITIDRLTQRTLPCEGNDRTSIHVRFRLPRNVNGTWRTIFGAQTYLGFANELVILGSVTTNEDSHTRQRKMVQSLACAPATN